MRRKRALCTLEQALEYENPGVIEDFRKSYAVSAEEAALLFEDTKRWLWLCGKLHELQSKGRARGLSADIKPALRLLDEMWHAFILHTHAYASYCETKLGMFIHHEPSSAVPVHARKKPLGPKAAEAHLRRYYGFIYDQLGEETFTRWFVEWPDTMTDAHLRRLLIKHKQGARDARKKSIRSAAK